MLTLFRTNQASAGLLLFLYALLLQLPAWLGGGAAYVAAEYTGGGALGEWSARWMNGRVVLNYLLPVVLLTLQGIVANVLVTRHRMGRKITQFPGLFLILTWALVPALRTYHPAQPAGLFVLLALLALARVYKNPHPATPLFNAGAWLGLAILFVPAAVVLLPAFAVGIGLLRRPDTRSVLQLLIGTLVILFLAAAGYYFFGGLGAAVASQLAGLGWVRWPEVGVAQVFGLALAGLLLLLSIVNQGSIVRLLGIEGSKVVSILYWVLFFAGAGYFLSGATGLGYLQLVTLVPGVALGLWFNDLAPGRAEFLHLLLFVAAIGAVVYPFYLA